jgi:hypothetical protein
MAEGNWSDCRQGRTVWQKETGPIAGRVGLYGRRKLFRLQARSGY